MVPGFTAKYNVNKLVYFEETNDVNTAIAREKEIKKWRREKKNTIVVAVNPERKDLSDGWFEISPFGRDDRSGRDESGGGTSSDRNDKSRKMSCDRAPSVISTEGRNLIYRKQR